MQTIKTPITGKEDYSNSNTPTKALIEFYKAFNNCDFELMSRNWANSNEIAMDNPLGGIKRGWTEIESVYKRIFEGKAEVYVEFYDYSIHETKDMFYAVGRERGYFKTNGNKLDLEIRTSRIFQRIENEWKQFHHHGSIEDPKLLDTYQKAVV